MGPTGFSWGLIGISFRHLASTGINWADWNQLGLTRTPPELGTRLLGVLWTPLAFKWARLGTTGINRGNWHLAAQCAGQLAERSGVPSVVDRFQDRPPRTRNKWAGGGEFAGFNN